MQTEALKETRPEESYRLCCVVVCDLETSRMGAPYIYDISRLRVKILSTYICRKKIYKMQHLEGSGTPVLYIGRMVLKG